MSSFKYVSTISLAFLITIGIIGVIYYQDSIIYLWNLSVVGKTPKYETCIITRVKNCAYLLPQWIEFHHNAGIDHLYIVNDCSKDNGKTIFWGNFYGLLGIVTFYESLTFNSCENHLPNEKNLIEFLFARAQSDCKWIAMIDPDEYIFPSRDSYHHIANFNNKNNNTDNNYRGTIKIALQNAKLPIVRMPWCYMSNGGHEKRPNNFLIDAYPPGILSPGVHIKTMAQSNYVRQWRSSHYPRYLRINQHQFNNTIQYEKYFSEIHTEMIGYNHTHKNETITCYQVVGPLFLRHYYILSREDYLAIRANRTKSSDGSDNPYTKDGWGPDTSYYNPCPIVGDIFRQDMSKRMRISARKNILEWVNISSSLANHVPTSTIKTDNSNSNHGILSWFYSLFRLSLPIQESLYYSNIDPNASYAINSSRLDLFFHYWQNGHPISL